MEEFFAKCFEMGTALIIHPYKVTLTLLRPVPEPKPDQVGPKGPTCHPCLVVKNFIIFMLQEVGPPEFWTYQESCDLDIQLGRRGEGLFYVTAG